MNTYGLGKMNAFGLGAPYPGTGPVQPPTNDILSDLVHDLMYELVIDVQDPQTREPDYDGRKRIL
jgi:hypothetical protein